MSTRSIGVMLPVALMFLLLTAGPVSADYITVSANSTYVEQVHANSGETISIFWSCPYDVRIVVKEPGGSTILDVTDDARTSLLSADRSGQYTITWYNTMSSSVTINREIEVIPVSVGGLFDSLARLMLILVIGIIAIIVVIVLVVAFAAKKEKAPVPPPAYQGTYGPPYYGPTPPASAVPGTCPLCGAAARPEMTFCEKCGARLR
jgi:hypothetical protein